MQGGRLSKADRRAGHSMQGCTMDKKWVRDVFGFPWEFWGTPKANLMISLQKPKVQGGWLSKADGRAGHSMQDCTMDKRWVIDVVGLQ